MQSRFSIVLAALIAVGASHVAEAEEVALPSQGLTASALRTMSLAEFERAALARQPELLVAKANTNAALAAAEQARAPLLPQVLASASYTRETGNYAPRPGITGPGSTATSGGSLFSPSYDYWQFALNATQLIYDFGQTLGKYDAAKLTADSQRLAEQTARASVLLGVRVQYFNARASRELVQVAKETLLAQRKHLAQVEGMVSVGTQPQIALAQQRASVANAVAQWITAQNAYETSKALLNQAAGIEQGTNYDVGNEDLPALSDEDQPLELLTAKAMAARPELLALTRLKEAQQRTLSAAKGGYGPSVTASAGATEAGLNLGQLVPNWNAGVGVSWYLFQGGLTRAQVRQAEAGLASVDAQSSLAELKVRFDVDAARLAVRAAKATIGATSDAVTSAREQLLLAEQRYSTGMGDIIELGDAQVAYTNAAAQAVQARYALASARAQLLAALGRI
jgi:outer membrane protein